MLIMGICGWGILIWLNVCGWGHSNGDVMLSWNKYGEMYIEFWAMIGVIIGFIVGVKK